MHCKVIFGIPLSLGEVTCKRCADKDVDIALSCDDYAYVTCRNCKYKFPLDLNSEQKA